MNKKVIIIITIILAIIVFPILIYLGILSYTSKEYIKVVTIKTNYSYELKINKSIIRVEQKQQWQCIKAPCPASTVRTYVVLNNKDMMKELNKLKNNDSIYFNDLTYEQKEVIRKIIKEDNY